MIKEKVLKLLFHFDSKFIKKADVFGSALTKTSTLGQGAMV